MVRSACCPLRVFAVGALVASVAAADVNYNFNVNGQGFTSEFISNPFSGAWLYKPAAGVGGTGGWSTDGQTPEVGFACTVDLVSPVVTVGSVGDVRLSFDHRHNFEYDGTRWDGGTVLVSVNGGAATRVPLKAFVSNGYDNFVASGSESVLAGQPAFTAKSSGYDSGAFITSVVDLGRFSPGDTVQVRFRFAGDTNTTGGIPTWAVDNISLAEGFSGSTLTYQGVLRDGGSPVAGPVDLRFSLYDSPTSTLAQDLIAGPVRVNPVPVGPGGIISVPIDFGPGAFDSRAAWIAVEVNKDGNYVPILPRSPVNPAPQATFALNAAFAKVAASSGSVPWGGVTGAPAVFPPWTPVTGGITYTGGSVGIGTTAPGAPLAVRASDNIAMTFERSNGSQMWNVNLDTAGPGSPGLFISENGVNPNSLVLRNGGNVGIGTVPAFPLHVAATGNNFPHAQIESNGIFGTWFNLLNSSAGGVYWRMISTGSSNGEGSGKLLIGFSAAGAPGFQSTVMTMQQNGNVGIGITGPSQKLTVNGNVLANNIAVPSSIRFKDHVSTMDDALALLLKLEGVRFDWKPEWAKERPGREHDIGFVAEDVEKVFPEVVFRDAEGNVTGMDYSRLTAVAVQAIKQQQVRFEAQVAALRADAARREAENAELRGRLEKLERLIDDASRERR